jgi:hypothetical protein
MESVPPQLLGVWFRRQAGRRDLLGSGVVEWEESRLWCVRLRVCVRTMVSTGISVAGRQSALGQAGNYVL